MILEISLGLIKDKIIFIKSGVDILNSTFLELLKYRLCYV